MTHEQKLNKILNGLLSRLSKRLSDKTDDKRLTFEFLCNVLFPYEDIQKWEMEHLKNRLIYDGYITFIDVSGIQLPDITQKGIKFMQKGGYEESAKMHNIEKEIKKETLKEIQRGKISIIISIISLIIAIVSCLRSFLK
jgi:hypothetical protein